MKVKTEQIEQTINKQIHPIYIISGDETLLVQEASDAIRRILPSKGIDERLRFVADAQFDWQEVIQENQALSLFSSQRLFDIQIDKLSEKHTKALTQLGNELSTDNIILLTLPKLDGRSQKTKWFTKLESQGVFVQIWPVESNRLGQWLQKRATSLELSLTRDAAALICERNEGNLLALSQELEKLVLTHGPGSKIDEQMIAESVSDSSRYSVYDLSDRILMGKVKESLHCLQQLSAEGVDNNILLWLLNREIQTLDKLVQASTSMPVRQACQKQRIWDKRIPFYESALSRHNINTLNYMQRYMALVDQTIKGLHALDIDTGMRNLVMMFCGVKAVQTELDIES
ncbi:DNA polymerase III subunit delta [Marinomonas sp. S3726]|uniref:DNA polymerase III subunit delta n=1 Tax=Marinomonas sp. S3726 TaxID=579484 RepID=UPI0005FA18A0|nr:DNA polymerase III subunit delta [Marinomonas sp. S3726]KJZ10662.1 DNA polymerase III subunit delta [Marinomonas sp. S3726]